jgi:hypothetical protein
MTGKLPVLRTDFIHKRGYRGWSLMGPGGMLGPGGMMNNWGYASSPSPFGWIGMIFIWLIPIGLIMLAVLGAIWLVRKVGNSKPPSS